MTFYFHLKLFQIKMRSQDQCVVLDKAVTLIAGHALGHLKLKVKGQCLALKCQSQSKCQPGWGKENRKTHNQRNDLQKCQLNQYPASHNSVWLSWPLS